MITQPTASGHVKENAEVLALLGSDGRGGVTVSHA
jgi:hypothetical protein